MSVNNDHTCTSFSALIITKLHHFQLQLLNTCLDDNIVNTHVNVG